MKIKETHYRVITPDSFSNIYTVSKGQRQAMRIQTIDEALAEIENFGSTDPDNEYYENWEDRRKQCKVVRITEIIEEVNLESKELS